MSQAPKRKSISRDKPLDRILIETAGNADPGPVVQTFLVDEFVARTYSLDGILTLLDAEQMSQLQNSDQLHGFMPETGKQLAFADRILVNKTDLVDDSVLVHVEDRIRSINPSVPIWRGLHSQIGMNSILDIDAWSLDKVLDTHDVSCLDDAVHNVITCHIIQGLVQCFNMAGHEVYRSHVPLSEEASGPWLWKSVKQRIVRGRLHLVHPNGQDIWVQQDVNSVGLDLCGEVDQNEFDKWLDKLRQDHSIDLFRYKGILAVRGRDAPFVFQDRKSVV